MTAINLPPLPPETIKMASAVFGKSNFYIAVGDQTERLFEGLNLEGATRLMKLSPQTLARLYLVTVFQFLETLPDHLAVDAARKRVEWKYALHLPLSSLDLEETWLCEFRSLLLHHHASRRIFDALLARLLEFKSLPDQEHQLEDSNQVLQHVCLSSRLAKIWLAINQTLEALALRQHEWLRSISLPHWYQRYNRYQGSLHERMGGEDVEKFAQSVGNDGLHLLATIDQAGNPEINKLEAIEYLRQVWLDLFILSSERTSQLLPQCTTCPTFLAGANRSAERPILEPK
jgi:transposase